MSSGSLWFFQAIGASLLWGIVYALQGRILHSGISVPGYVFFELLVALPVLTALAWVGGYLHGDTQLLAANWRLLIQMIAVAICFTGANVLIAVSIAGKNATLAAIIEIAYPLFAFLFTWLVFRQIQLTWQTACGGLLIAAGIMLIYLKR